MRSARVVIATGLASQEYRPEEFDGLPRDLVSHVVEHADLGKFRGKRVGVVGRGRSACENAAILSQARRRRGTRLRAANILWLGLDQEGRDCRPATTVFKRFRKVIDRADSMWAHSRLTG